MSKNQPLSPRAAKLPNPEQLHELFYIDDSRPDALRWKVKRPQRAVGDAAGSVRADGFRQLCVNGRKTYAGRVVWAMVHGAWPEFEIGHANGNRSDDRPANLVHAPKAVHHMNTRHAASHNALGVLCVTKKYRRFIAKVGGTEVGRYASAEEAAAAAHKFKEARGLIYRRGMEFLPSPTTNCPRHALVLLRL